MVVRRLKFIVAVVVSVGCGVSGDTVRVSGQLMKDGKPYGAKLSGKEPETFAVDFLGTVKERPYRFSATINEGGAFRVDGGVYRDSLSCGALSSSVDAYMVMTSLPPGCCCSR